MKYIQLSSKCKPQNTPKRGLHEEGLIAVLLVYVSSKSWEFFPDYNTTKEKSDHCLTKHMRSVPSEDDELHTITTAQWSIQSWDIYE